MIWVILLFTILLVIDCLLLILLVLVQLPKKEAGIGQAFGGAATDALFGAGSGNALTKMTKYATVAFLLLTMCLSILNAQQSKSNKSRFATQVQAAGQTAPVLPPASPVVPPIMTNVATNAAAVTNAAAAATNAASAAPTNAPATAPANPGPQ
jgi:preprotein translocase subunit SecG